MARYRAKLDGIVGVAPTAEDGGDLASSHHLFTLVLDEGVDRAGFREALTRERIQTSVHYPPAHRFSIYAAPSNDLPITVAYGTRTVTLPLFSHMGDEQVDAVVDGVRKALLTSTGARSDVSR